MGNRKIRVLMVIPNLRPSNGVTTFVMNYFRKLDHDNIQIDFATLSYRESPYIEEVEKVGSKVIVLPSLMKHPLGHLRKCKEIITNGNYDIVHVNTLNQAIPLLNCAKKDIKVRIMHSHSTEIGETQIKRLINRMFLPVLLKLTNYDAACSSIAGEALFGDKAFTVIPNVIDTEKFKFDESIREEVRTSENVQNMKVFGSVGRLAAPKNPRFAIDVMEQVLKRRNDAVYWWIGSGPLDSTIQEYIDSKKLTDRIRLFGSRNDISDLYQAMDVFFLPSCFEGFGLTCLEAQAAGLSCVVSDKFPSEVNVTENVEFLSLDSSLNEWAEVVENALQTNANKERANQLCEESIYSQIKSGALLSDYYYSCIEAAER